MEKNAIEVISISIMILILWITTLHIIRIYVNVIFSNRWEGEISKVHKCKNILIEILGMAYASAGCVLMDICVAKLGYKKTDFLDVMFYLIIIFYLLYMCVRQISINAYSRIFFMLLKGAEFILLQILMKYIWSAACKKYLVIAEDWMWQFMEIFVYYTLFVMISVAVYNRVERMSYEIVRCVKMSTDITDSL